MKKKLKQWLLRAFSSVDLILEIERREARCVTSMGRVLMRIQTCVLINELTRRRAKGESFSVKDAQALASLIYPHGAPTNRVCPKCEISILYYTPVTSNHVEGFYSCNCGFYEPDFY